MGPAPVANVTARCIAEGADCSGEFFDGIDGGGENHGPAVVEIVKDMAPDAQIYIGRASTESDYYALVDWFSAQGVRIISRSLGSRYDGPGDGRGALDGVADHAVDLGIMWVNSGGNNAINRYYRSPGAADRFLGGVRCRRQRHVAALQRLHRAGWRALGERLGRPTRPTHGLRPLPVSLADRQPVDRRPPRIGDSPTRGPAHRRSRSSRAAPARLLATRSTCGSSTSRAIPPVT